MTDLIEWGRSPEGDPVLLAILSDGNGLEVRVSSYGATLTSIRAPDREGRVDDVLLGFSTLDRYLAPDFQAGWPYFGSTIGRYANRIAGARFTIDGQEYRLTANEGPNQNHGGLPGFDRAIWRMEPIANANGVRLHLRSPDGDQGFPGTLDVVAEVVLNDGGEVAIRYHAVTDRPTHVSLTSHGYFNLAGRAARTVTDHQLSVAADHMLPTDRASIPSGQLRPVAGTPFDLRRPVALGNALAGEDPQLAQADGLDHCFVLDREQPIAALLHHPGSGRAMALNTTAPGLQVYSANGFDGTLADEEGRPFVRRQAIALEAQHFPDSPNQPNFPSTLLRPGDIYQSETRLRFFTD